MNRAYTTDTRPSPVYHPPLPLNTSAHRTKFNSHHHAPSIASPLTPSSTTSTTAPSLTPSGRPPWVRSRAATTNNTYYASATSPASYKDEFSCYTPTSPVPAFPPPSVDDHDSNSMSNNHISAIKVHTSKRSRTQTSAAASLYSPLPTSTSMPLSPLAFTTIDNNIWTNATSFIDTTLNKKVDFHNGQQHPHDRPLVNVKGGVASHRYASILPSPRYRAHSTSSQHQQLSPPLPSPLDSNNDSPDVPPPQAMRAQTTSLHHNLHFPLQGQGLDTASLLSDFPLPPVPATATTAGVTGTTNMLDGKVMPWLQEAMQTVTMLESRLQELEEDCKVIPLYEQDRLEMIQMIQDLEVIVRQDHGWMDHAEIAIQWTTFILENALISSSSTSYTNNSNSNSSFRLSMRTRARTGEMNKEKGMRETVIPGLERNTRSEGMLPSLVAERSSTLGILSSSKLEMRTGTKRRLSESLDVDPSRPDLAITSTYSTTVDNTDTSRPSSTSSSTLSSSSLSPNKNDSPSSSNAEPVIESQETVYRNAIIVALRHLKTIDIAPPLPSVSSSSSKTSTRNGSGRNSTSRGHGGRQEQEKGAPGAFKQGNRRQRTRGAPDSALKEWLDNSSMMSLDSNVINEEFLHEDEDEEREREKDFSISRVLATVEDIDSNRERDTGNELDVQAKTPELRSPSSSSSSQMRRRRHLLVGSLNSLQKSTDTTSAAHTIPEPNLFPVSTNSSTETLSHALNSTAATISGSSQSLNSTLSPTFIDERVFLKQHILHLDKLRAQELNRHQRIEEGHRQLVKDLGRFSKELLGSVNELTCAQAALDEASELALLALGCFEKDAPNGGGAGSMEVMDVVDSQQKQQPDNASDKDSTATTAAIRQKRLVAASRKELESSGGLAEECINRIRRLAADCVGITELAGKGHHHHHQQTSGAAGINASFIHPALNSVHNTAKDGGESGEGELQRYAFEATPTASVETFVDGIAFQEFEDHLASVRSSFSTSNGAPSESKIFKRILPSSSSSSSSARLTATKTASNTKVSRRNHPSTTNTSQSIFMRKVLSEDIYPCLLINHDGRSSTTTATVATKQSYGWMSALLSSSSTQSSASLPPLLHGINNNTNSNVQGRWVQQLLKAMEANACEIEAWRPSPPTAVTITNTTTNAGSVLVNKTTTAAPKTACCLCGTIRPCEFRLRLLDPSSSSSSSCSSSSYSSSAPTSSTISSSTQSPQQQQYQALDRFCRERIVAVCDFMFLTHLRQGLLEQPTSLELFRRALGLRQRMAHARIGSMDLVGGGGAVGGGGGGGGGGEALFSITRE